jgi:hypothetical protein
MAARVKRPKTGPDEFSALQRLLHTGGVSIDGLSKLLKQLHCDVASRSTLRRENDRVFAELCFREELPLHNGGSWGWEFADPLKLLVARIEHSPEVARLFLDAVRRSPPSQEHPWSIVVGFDEFIPGNKLQADNRRKTMVLSFSFLELGQLALSRDAAWVTPICVRTAMLKQIAGGWPCCLKIFLRRLLLGATGIAVGGVPVTLGGQHYILYGTVTNLLSDGDGLRIALDWKGQGAIKPCFKHFNVLKKDRTGSHT